MEHAIFVELSVFDDFQRIFFIAVSALKALKEEDLKDLGKVVSNDLFVKKIWGTRNYYPRSGHRNGKGTQSLQGTFMPVVGQLLYWVVTESE